MTCLVVRSSETMKKEVGNLCPGIGRMGRGHVGPLEESGTCQLRRTARVNKMEQFETGRDVFNYECETLVAGALMHFCFVCCE